jgi:hypothetical protein
MIRTLVLIVGASFVLCVACLVGAAALGWRHMGHSHWHDWNVRFDGGHHGGWVIDNGPTNATNAIAAPSGAPSSRDIAWGGGDTLDIDVPGDVQFTQGPGPGKITVSGPADVISHVVVSGSHLQLDDDGDYSGSLKIVMTAPDVRRFSISGADTLAINNFNQDELDLNVSGDGNVTAKGKAHTTKIDISGSSQVDFAGLAVDAAEASISGSGRAAIAPVNSAELHISGDGEIDLLTHPAQLSSDVSGSGRILEGQPAPKPS